MARYFHTKLFRNRFQKINYQPKVYYCKRTNKKTIIVHHYCPHTYNAGDHFVIYSIRKHLKKYLKNVVFIPKAVAGNRGWGKPIGLKGTNIFYSNKYADAVILGGSDQYNDWSPKITAGEIKELVPPLFFIGLGISSTNLNTKPKLTNPKFYNDILVCNEKTVLSSVRDKITYDFLKNIGYDKAIITGCPALYIFNEKLHFDRLKKKVMLTFPYPLLRTNKTNLKYKILIELINKVIKYLESIDCIPVIVCHDDRDVPAAQELFNNLDIFFSNYPENYFILYKQAKFVIGSRLHATILASALGIPSININLDLRGKGFSETFGLAKWNLDYNDPDLYPKILERIKILSSNDLSYAEEFIDLRNDYQNVFNNFMKNTAEKILNFS